MTSPKVKSEIVTGAAEPAHAAHAAVAEKFPPVGIAGRRARQVRSAATAPVALIADEPSAARSVTTTAAPTGELLCAEP